MTITTQKINEAKSLIAQAAAIDDLDEACILLQDAIGQEDGGVADLYFSGVRDWPSLGVAERADHLAKYLELEKVCSS